MDDIKKKKYYNRSFFTLMEMVIVIAIIALLAAVALPAFMNQFEKSRRKTAKMQIENLKFAVNAFNIDMKRWPNDLNELLKDESGDKKWDGPYLENTISLPKDPWGNDYVYTQPGEDGRSFDIVSYGADGIPGGEKKAADIVSWTGESE